ncbi:adenylyl-sulfate kinase [Marinomonas transparens]|uniref:Adenylyl-sulfate kinase n=1 Tax=Marinomonas transparens TaxID=2795388 RepID=A0A934MXY6_9GAMM|nr:adenylyl-sulfate kinase [Marinomonas transparens]MBJ7539829.1 adenylyl-sulfate kinase [Marinomonas transparens]
MNNLTWQNLKVTKQHRLMQKKQPSYVLWFTGLSGSGKSTLANALEQALFERGLHTYLLDGDNLRHGLNQDLGFSETDRTENMRRVGEVSKLFTDAGLIVLAAFISPFQSDRSFIKDLIGEENVIDVYLDTPLSVCEQRDTKGLYKQARAGKIKGFTGIDSPYEAPKSADIVFNTDIMSVNDCVSIILAYLGRRLLLPSV